MNVSVQRSQLNLSSQVVVEWSDVEVLQKMPNRIHQEIVRLVAEKIAEILVAEKGQEIIAGINNDLITQAVIAAAVKRVQEELSGHSTSNSGGGR